MNMVTLDGGNGYGFFQCYQEILGRYVKLHFLYDSHLKLCEAQVLAYTNDTSFHWTGVACIEGQKERLHGSFGEIRSPSLFTDGIYPPNANCTWEIEVEQDKVSKSIGCFAKKIF